MKKNIESFSPINSDLDFMFFITNLYLEQNKIEYKEDIENVIRTTHNLVSDKIKSKQIDPVIFSIVTALMSFGFDYFKNEIKADRINRANIETVRGMLSTLRHSSSFQ